VTCPTQPWALSWSDVDPSRVTFDPEPARAIAARLLAGPMPTTDEGWDAIEDAIDTALVEAYGFWVVGWRWAKSEPGGGGPVRVWCCGPHSLPRATARDVVAAVTDWRAWVEGVDALFRAIDGETSGLALATRVERAAARVLAAVVERTECEDAWYRTFTTTFAWWVERVAPGVDARRVSRALFKGRFASWIMPDSAVAARACAEIGAAVATEAEGSAATFDALGAWTRVRARVRWSGSWTCAEGHVARDGHLAYINGRDAERDATRRARMTEAIATVRGAARAGEPLDFALLARCQRVVLGLDVAPSFRPTDAWAKGGRERYGRGPRTPAEFERCLGQAADGSPIPCAARAYLDVCFFHPFDDGNARAARLALDWVLTRAGLALRVADPIFSLPRWADDEPGVYAFMALLAALTARA